jgi:sugar phosphate isomerase/epimerase
VTVLAHPFSLGLDTAGLDRALGELAEAGLVGMECYYGRYTPEERDALAELAHRHDLVATGGSDFHGSFKPDLVIGTGTGDLCVPDTVLAELEARRPEVAP